MLEGGSELARFTYDAEQRRAQKVSSGVTRTYIYDRAAIAEERRTDGTTTRYIYGQEIDEVMAAVDGTGTVTYYLADHLASIVQETNATGQVTLTREYDPFGNIVGGSTAGGFAFTGREWDSEIGLSYFRARYYDPTLGRFDSADPLGLLGGANRYAYVENNPNTRIDPWGYQWWNPKKWWDWWKQAQKAKRCAELAKQCDQRVQCECNSQSFANPGARLSLCTGPRGQCCAEQVALCVLGLSYDLEKCAPPCPVPSASPSPSPDPCTIYGHDSPQCEAWWEEFKKRRGVQ